MHITHLRITNFRNIADADIEPHPRVNVFHGANGAGKTSVLEAVFMVSRGKSFRTVRSEELIGPESGVFRIFLGLDRDGESHRLGLERDGRQWKARRDGQDVTVLSELSRGFPVVLMEPNSHELVSGSPDARRRFLDWGVFHVEPEYLEWWRRYARALKQRNAALRGNDERLLDGLDELVAAAGSALSEMRARYVGRLDALVGDSLQDDRAALTDIALSYEAGWREDSLLEALRRTRQRDREQGSTSQGPHRAEVAILRDGQRVRTVLSRGEQKALAAALLLSQARLLAEEGQAPVILLDDLASEFDGPHLENVLETAVRYAPQVWVTGVEPLAVAHPHTVFHVEHGALRKMV
ncbi:DNA replication/repair protein RecF [Elongatibacter sediminis]|uniref:DNA replication and repair protein RecF n=1 Tax=Elongatibacter sediminis TaxID=3119006 RepID=A0AAW9RKV0_9GAMM